MIHDLPGFLGLSIVLIVVPGPDMALVARNALAGGRRSALATGTGVAAGLAIWTLAASAGLAALLRASEPAFLAVRLVGGCYLVYLGGRALVAAVRAGRDGAGTAGAQRTRAARATVALRQGLFSNLANPKIAVFFTSFLPQFMPAGRASLAGLLLLGLHLLRAHVPVAARVRRSSSRGPATSCADPACAGRSTA